MGLFSSTPEQETSQVSLFELLQAFIAIKMAHFQVKAFTQNVCNINIGQKQVLQDGFLFIILL